MAERVVFMRHLQDQDNLFFKNNSPIIDSELDRVADISKEIATKAKGLGFTRIHLITSSKARAQITAERIAEGVEQCIEASIERDDRIRELDQGNYVLPEDYKPGDNFQVLRDAWLVFFEETFASKNLHYRFGDPAIQIDSTYKYPDLPRHFTKYGENQIEFSIRYYSFLSDLHHRFRDQAETLPIIVTHQALATRFLELSHISLSNQVVVQGTLPLMEWDAYQEIKNQPQGLNLGYGEASIVSLQTIDNLIQTFEPEIEMLKLLRDGGKSE